MSKPSHWGPRSPARDGFPQDQMGTVRESAIKVGLVVDVGSGR